MGTEGSDYIYEGFENMQGGESVQGGEHLQHPHILTQVNPTPPFELPTWDLLPPGDFLRMSSDALVYHSPERSVPSEPARNDNSLILSHPTFNLLSQSPHP